QQVTAGSRPKIHVAAIVLCHRFVSAWLQAAAKKSGLKLSPGGGPTASDWMPIQGPHAPTLGNAVEWVREQEDFLRMAAGQIGRLVTHIGDDRIAARLDSSPHRRLEVGRRGIMRSFRYHVESRVSVVADVA